MTPNDNSTEPTPEGIPLWVYLLFGGVTILIASVTYYQTGSILWSVVAVICEFIVAGVHSLNVFFQNDSS